MLSLSEKFLTENARDGNTPSLLVEVLSRLLESHQTTQADWQANTGANNVDYASSPGDVILAERSSTVHGHEGSGTEYMPQDGERTGDIFAQGFKLPSNVKVRKVGIRLSKLTGGGSSIILTRLKICTGWSAGSGTVVATSSDVNVSDAGWFEFPVEVNLAANTQYHLVLERISGGYMVDEGEGWYASPGNVYPNGTLWVKGSAWYEYTAMDGYFRVYGGYEASGYIRTRVMDLGEVPTEVGEWIFEDIRPSGTSIAYQAWASATGAFSGEETSLGTITDGDPITVLRRYYRVRADLSTSNYTDTPVLQRIKAQFGVYETYSDNVSLGYEPAVLSVSALTTTIDPFEKSTISQIDLALGLTESVSKWLKTGYPRNQLVKVRAGFVAPGWNAADYENYFQGQVEDWRIEPDYGVKLQVQDYSKAWKARVPGKWESALDDVAWSNVHPVDVCLDILRNHINVRDSKLVLGSFEAVKGALSGWKVSRTVTGDTVDADELLQELRILMGCFFIPQADGRIRIKRWDPNEAAVDSLTDDDMANVRWEANSASLINQTHIYYGWDSDGNKAQDFTELRVAPDAASQANWNELRIKEIKDKWTRPSETGQVQDLESKVLARFANPPSVISCEVARSRIYLEVGDIVTVTTMKAPSVDLGGITNERYQVINRNLDFKRDVIRLKLLAVAGGY